ncbi:MAG: DUF1722 domain-containing protein [Candidatus Binataceae bacterium]|nr:DUF1722 domain-containing protein [Candidatus Binataceae bacterium]
MTPTDQSAAAHEPPPRIGVSSCLLGQQVRFDGGHKRSEFLVEVFGRFVDFVPFCPEVELGLGVPRETLRIERRDGAVRLIANRSGADHTAAMRTLADRRTAAIARDDLSGYVLKKDSPSCGMERVRIYPASGIPTRDGRGLFAETLMRRYPNLPVEEEGRLNDARLRENFIERVFAYRRLRSFFSARWTVGGLVAFHTAHKLQLLAHAPKAYAELGRTVAEARAIDRAELRERYEREFMAALARPATAARHVNVMQHMAGYFSDRLDPGARLELASLIEDYRGGLVPLIVPITLMRHYVRHFAIAYLAGQVYLEPHPRELMLRNHV